MAISTFSALYTGIWRFRRLQLFDSHTSYKLPIGPSMLNTKITDNTLEANIYLLSQIVNNSSLFEFKYKKCQLLGHVNLWSSSTNRLDCAHIKHYNQSYQKIFRSSLLDKWNYNLIWECKSGIWRLQLCFGFLSPKCIPIYYKINKK